jgi:2-oxoglutarate dehydrogenase E1 component
VSELYKLFLDDPELVSEQWRSYFLSLNGEAQLLLPAPNLKPAQKPDNAVPGISGSSALQYKLSQFIDSYRTFGHLKAKVNPLSHGVAHLPIPSDLTPEFYGIGAAEIDETVYVGDCCGLESAAVSEIIERLERTYCGKVGYEYMHLTSAEERLWLQQFIEGNKVRKTFSDKTEALQRARALIDAEGFESEIHKKYVGAKRFSIEGGEVVIPMLNTLINSPGLANMVIGMAHRGRLNVLANIVGKPLKEIFCEFEDKTVASKIGVGDVKYHMGWESARKNNRGESVKISLAPNPSHLEFVNPVVEGIVRVLQDRKYKANEQSVCPLLIHGDAAFIGQGIVPETFNLARVPGYKTGGTIHIVINNQIGFTTSDIEARSCNYCSDVAKAFDAPIFHVNGEEVDTACGIVELAWQFRNAFQRDVVIDVYCYRKYGHNEGDDPTYTQPSMYKEIKQKKPLSLSYPEALIGQSVISEAEHKALIQAFKDRFNKEHEAAGSTVVGELCPLYGREVGKTVKTAAASKTLIEVISSLTKYPEGFTVHPKLQAQLVKRVESVKEGKNIDWGAAEALAYGSLVLDGVHVRLSGQDSGRGTFSHRHLELYDYVKDTPFYPLNSLRAPGSFEVYNSTLSESGVLGFEFGYAAKSPQNSLVIWEAQFGDFGNGAQVIIDQFIATSEVKWGLLSGVVLLLPHGFEGQGPEHSSARLERFLQLAANNNMTITNLTSGAQLFHLLRRQALSEIKRPLIIMSPKSLLRSADAASNIKDFTDGKFQPLITKQFGKEKKAGTLILCSGKVYYDIAATLGKNPAASATVTRIEQIYPFPEEEIKKLLKEAKDIYWVQEEHQNAGAFRFIEARLHALGVQVNYIGRDDSASPATGSPAWHAKELQELLAKLPT